MFDICFPPIKIKPFLNGSKVILILKQWMFGYWFGYRKKATPSLPEQFSMSEIKSRVPRLGILGHGIHAKAWTKQLVEADWICKGVRTQGHKMTDGHFPQDYNIELVGCLLTLLRFQGKKEYNWMHNQNAYNWMFTYHHVGCAKVNARSLILRWTLQLKDWLVIYLFIVKFIFRLSHRYLWAQGGRHE